jgi:hypothetical protein
MTINSNTFDNKFSPDVVGHSPFDIGEDLTKEYMGENQGFSLTKGQIATGLGYASTIISGYGQFTGLQEKADSYRDQAALDRQRAEEIQRRAEISITKIGNDSNRVVNTQKTALTGRGVSASGTLALALARDSFDKAHTEIENVDTAMRYEKGLALAQAEANEKAADAAEDASWMSLISTGLKITAIATGNAWAAPLVDPALKAAQG